jgi:hypothetical protein
LKRYKSFNNWPSDNFDECNKRDTLHKASCDHRAGGRCRSSQLQLSGVSARGVDLGELCPAFQKSSRNTIEAFWSESGSHAVHVTGAVSFSNQSCKSTVLLLPAASPNNAAQANERGYLQSTETQSNISQDQHHSACPSLSLLHPCPPHGTTQAPSPMLKHLYVHDP